MLVCMCVCEFAATPKVEMKYSTFSSPELANCQHIFFYGRVSTTSDDDGYCVCLWLLAVQRAWRLFWFNMVSIMKRKAGNKFFLFHTHTLIAKVKNFSFPSSILFSFYVLLYFFLHSIPLPLHTWWSYICIFSLSTPLIWIGMNCFCGICENKLVWIDFVMKFFKIGQRYL